jgi:Zn-dependent metalloprotease
MNRILAVTLSIVLSQSAVFAATNGADPGGRRSGSSISTNEFGGDLGTMRKVQSGVPRAKTNASTVARDRWADGAETFILGFAGRRGANGSESFTARRAFEDKLGQAHVRLSQSIAGLPVVGAELIVHADAKSGKVLGVNGRFAVDVDLPREPRVSADDAIARAIAEYGIAGGRIVGANELNYIVEAKGEVRLAWTNLVAYQSEQGDELDRIFADAVTGEPIVRHPQVRRAKSRQVYNCGNQTVWANCTLMFSEGGSSADTTAMAAYNNVGIAYDYFWNTHGQDSVDDSGATIKQGVHFGSNFNNAGWTPAGTYTAIAYGDGNGTLYSSFPFSLDVVGHEFTHGVVYYAAGLPYSGESGSIDEGLSDIFGASIETYSDGSVNADVWKIADEIYTPGTSGDALRYLNDPATASNHKDYYPTRTFNSDLHRNSGIASLAYYLLVQGGQHPRGPENFNVSAQGIATAEAIFYRALNTYMTSSTNFRELRTHTLQAATDIHGLYSAPYNAMWNAWSAVGNYWDSRVNSLSPAGSTWTSASYTTVTTGLHTGQLYGPAGANFDLYLDKWNGSSWATVDTQATASTNELSEYSGTAGLYRWRVYAASGTGNYSFHWNKPY